jgi:hypothetical protein
VETYLGRGQAAELATRERQARSAAEELTRATARVRFDRSIYVPKDEICFFVFEAPVAPRGRLSRNARNSIRSASSKQSRPERRSSEIEMGLDSTS